MIHLFQTPGIKTIRPHVDSNADCLLWKLSAARDVKLGTAAGSTAADVSSASDSPLPEPHPSQQDQSAKASALPVSQPPTPAISMTAALKNVGAVSICEESVVVLFSAVWMKRFVCLIDHITERKLERTREDDCDPGVLLCSYLPFNK